jgi:hypothetical protein
LIVVIDGKNKYYGLPECDVVSFGVKLEAGSSSEALCSVYQTAPCYILQNRVVEANESNKSFKISGINILDKIGGKHQMRLAGL